MATRRGSVAFGIRGTHAEVTTMSKTAELHVQAAVWTERGWHFATLFLEGEAPDKATGSQLRTDALLQAVRARGLPLTTDPEQVSLRPVKGWRVHRADSGAITLEWPHFTPLLAATPISLPDGWPDAATEHGIVLVFVGAGLGLHQHAGDGDAHPANALQRIAEDGCLSGGAVALTGSEARLDGTIGHPHRAGQPVIGANTTGSPNFRFAFDLSKNG
jgi:hypothetical protein